MVRFRKHISGATGDKKVNPREIYDELDRESDKGPLRPAQEAVLDKWFEKHRTSRDVILKLHTGQGKTLVGLLMLQSRLNSGNGPSLYLCPNIFLAEQTRKQAAEFGFKHCLIGDDGIPAEFSDSQSILITHVQKLFNGWTKFGLGHRSHEVGSLVLDDAHACINAIRKSFTIEIPGKNQAYSEIVNLFSESLEKQGRGEFADIKAKKPSAFLPVPYWDWQDKVNEVTDILARHAEAKFIAYQWPILKNIIAECLCVVAGEKLEISPYRPPLEAFGSYEKADQRIYMSATINDDSFLIKSLNVAPDAVKSPVRYEKEKWSGEKMVLIPSLIHEELSRERVVNMLAVPIAGRKKGVVALTPSFAASELWEHCGAEVADRKSIINAVARLKSKDAEKVAVFANRYDGIDLPDDSCRTLVLDGKPFSEDLIDLYHEECRGRSDVIDTKVAQTIEQGMGRHIRGEKDYGVVVLLGPSLIRAIRSKQGRRYFSSQTRHQIEIGLEIAQISKEDLDAGKEPQEVLLGLMQQCIDRDDEWKDFYKSRMDEMPEEEKDVKILDIFVKERDAEELYGKGDVDGAISVLNSIVDNITMTDEEKGWYIQEMGRYAYASSHMRSEELQKAAHNRNKMLLFPKGGTVLQKLAPVPQKRADAIRAWLSSFGGGEDLMLRVGEILDGLQFGVKADRFEESFRDLGIALGYASERPDKEWKTGPDNLWCLHEGDYLLAECKNEVLADRKDILQSETGQMNNSCAWFDRNYPGARVTRILVTPARQLAAGAGFNQEVKVMNKSSLQNLKKSVRKFFQEFVSVDLKDVPDRRVEAALSEHKLKTSDIKTCYAVSPRLPGH